MKVHKISVEFYCMKLSNNADGLKKIELKRKTKLKVWNRNEEFKANHEVEGHTALHETALSSDTNSKFRRVLKLHLYSDLPVAFKLPEGFRIHWGLFLS